MAWCGGTFLRGEDCAGLVELAQHGTARHGTAGRGMAQHPAVGPRSSVPARAAGRCADVPGDASRCRLCLESDEFLHQLIRL